LRFRFYFLNTQCKKEDKGRREERRKETNLLRDEKTETHKKRNKGYKNTIRFKKPLDGPNTK